MLSDQQNKPVISLSDALNVSTFGGSKLVVPISLHVYYIIPNARTLSYITILSGLILRSPM